MFRTIILACLLFVCAVCATTCQNAHNNDAPRDFCELKLTSDGAQTMINGPSCQALLVESIPANLTYPPCPPKHTSTHSAWQLIIEQARNNLTIASFYWSLLAQPQFNASHVEAGRDVFNLLVKKARQLNLSIAENGTQIADAELDQLVDAGAKVYWVDVTKMLGAGVLHTKLWTADRKLAYVGSANMDWRSLTQVKELGVLLINCPELVGDLERIHMTYQLLSKGLPDKWPENFQTKYNKANPISLQVNEIPSRVYFSSSPPEFNPPGRTNDLDAILNIIDQSKQFIYISVMDYLTEVVNYSVNGSGQFWPIIDDALRAAAVDRHVEVRLLISQWPHSSKSIPMYLESLRLLNGLNGARLRVRYFIVPTFTADQEIIPHARVNHNKYMVTDTTAYIGTSNWSGDYFINTGGVGFVYEEQIPSEYAFPQSQNQTLRTQLLDIFLRDWNSEYTYEQWQ